LSFGRIDSSFDRLIHRCLSRTVFMITQTWAISNKEFAHSLIHPPACRDLKIVGLPAGEIAHSFLVPRRYANGFHPLPAPLRALLSRVAPFLRGRGIPACQLKWHLPIERQLNSYNIVSYVHHVR
jgi:hypothetical protein